MIDALADNKMALIMVLAALRLEAAPTWRIPGS